MILPAMGVVSEIIGTYCHKHVFGYKFIAFSSIAIALLGFLVWGHHMFVSGQSDLAGTIFSLITFSIAIPSAIKVFNWLTTMYNGSIELRTSMLYGMSFIWVFSIGGLTGLPCATMVTDVHLHDTYFVVAHFHYVMVGGMVFAFLGGLQHWWPKMFGKMYNEAWSKVAWLLVFVGFNTTFFVQFFMGLRGMPRRYWAYQPEFQTEHVISTIGSYIMGLGLVLLAGVLIHSLLRGAKAPANPWGGSTLEWQSPSPPPLENFATDPIVGDPYEYEAINYDDKTGYYYRNPNYVSTGHH
jgi:cytochrome c oxidase subunit 1